MREINGDIWVIGETADCVVVPTNGEINSKGELVMGKGVALDAQKRVRALPREAGKLVALYGNTPFFFREWKIATFPTKRYWREKSSLSLIENSARELSWIADKERLKTIVLPRVGCGLGGLDWSVVKPLLDGLFDDRFIVCEQPGDISSDNHNEPTGLATFSGCLRRSL